MGISQKTKLENFLRNNDKQASFLKNYGDNIKRYIKLHELKRKMSNGTAKSSKVQAAQSQLEQVASELKRMQRSQYPIFGSNSENLWQKIMDLRSGPNGHPSRQRFNLKV